jgi:ribonuclease R
MSNKRNHAGHAEVSEGDVLAFLAKQSEAASLREIAAGLKLHHAGRRELKKMIAQLDRHKALEEPRPGRYRLAGQRKHSDEPASPSAAHRSDKKGEKRADGGERPQRASSAASSDPNQVSGRIVVHRDGYGFVVPDRPVPGVVGDLFIGRDSLGDAMHGDRVLARIERRKTEGRAEARIVRVLDRAHATVVGIFQYGSRGNVVRPYEARLQQDIIIPPGAELTPELRAKHGLEESSAATSRRQTRLEELDGAIVNVELTRFPHSGVLAAGRVIEILGRPGDLGVDVEIILRKHHLPHQFPAEVLAEAQQAPQQVRPAELEGRRDFRQLPIVTIDGETAKDFDDAVYVERRPGGRWNLQVHIADVAQYVRRATPLDREAHLRGTSVYFPDRAIPMLPVELSNGICSLNPQVDRLVMSALMELNSAGEVTAVEFAAGVIRSVERMTYTNVNKVLEGDAKMTARYSALAEDFRAMKELALLLNARRTRRGAIDFDLPEPLLEFDELGRMTGILRSERNIAHRLIEEFMLAANEAVAAYLERRGLGSLTRAHEKPDPKKVLEFEEIAAAFGYSLGVSDLSIENIPVRHGRVPAPPRGAKRGGYGRGRPMTVTVPGKTEFDIRPQHYQNLTRKIAGKPEERILSYLMLRSLKQARYTPEPLGHFALAASDYTHFTSPIRRYPDLIVHRVLKWALEHPAAPAPSHAPAHPRGADHAPRPGPYRPAELDEIAVESSEAERRGDAAERELVEWKTAQFMEQHLGEEFEALVISAQKWGFYVELLDLFVEGLVPMAAIEELAGERCYYRERDRAISAGGGRKVWRLGDRVRVRVDRIDPILRRVEFALLPSASAAR